MPPIDPEGQAAHAAHSDVAQANIEAPGQTMPTARKINQMVRDGRRRGRNVFVDTPGAEKVRIIRARTRGGVLETLALFDGKWYEPLRVYLG